MKISEAERQFLIEALKQARLELETLSHDYEWFVTETPELVDSALEILGEGKE